MVQPLCGLGVVGPRAIRTQKRGPSRPFGMDGDERRELHICHGQISQALIARETLSPTSHSLSGSRSETELHDAGPVWSSPSIEASSAKAG